MRSIKRGLKTLGLALLAAMGLMAFTAVGAQAVTWDINSSEIKAHESFTAQLKPGQTVLFLVPTDNLVFHCSALDVETGLLYNSDPPKAHISFFFLNCETKVKGVAAPGCKPEILLVKAVLLPILHSGKVYLLAEPLTGSIFTTYHYNEETCALGPLPSISGSFVFQCENAAGTVQQSCSTAAATQYIGPAPTALFPSDGLKYGLNTAETHSKAEVTLSGANIGKTFAALV